MKARLHIAIALLLGLAAGFAGAGAFAAPEPASLTGQVLANTVNPAGGPAAKSPVDQFRRLLAMNNTERENFLATRPVDDRDKIRLKLKDYEDMKPQDRELRLRATQLRWHLLRLLQTPNTNRAAQLDSIADLQDREMVRERLQNLHLLPAQLQHEVTDNESALRYFVGSDSPPLIDHNVAALPPAEGRDLIEKWNVLNSLPAVERERIIGRFRAFFDLTPVEKQQALDEIAPTQRGQMEIAVKNFDRLTAAEREKCINSIDNFARLNAGQRTEFLQNAGEWKQMSEGDRRLWQELVSHLPSPPLPPGFSAPLPKGFALPENATNN